MVWGEWVKNLFGGQFFGEVCIFLRSRRRTATVSSLVNADFLSITGDDFEKLLQDYPDDLEPIKTIAKKNLLSTVKLYPPKLFAKLVPKNEFKDYLIRKKIWLTNEEEDDIELSDDEESRPIDLGKLKRPLTECERLLENAKFSLTKINEAIKRFDEELDDHYDVQKDDNE